MTHVKTDMSITEIGSVEKIPAGVEFTIGHDEMMKQIIDILEKSTFEDYVCEWVERGHATQLIYTTASRTKYSSVGRLMIHWDGYVVCNELEPHYKRVPTVSDRDVHIHPALHKMAQQAWHDSVESYCEDSEHDEKMSA